MGAAFVDRECPVVDGFVPGDYAFAGGGLVVAAAEHVDPQAGR
ncbi:hypothetical protein [Streptomyces sp. NPDC046727]